MKHARISAWLLIATACIHVVTGFIAGREAFSAMAHDGFWMSARASSDNQFATWFVLAGGAFLFPGLLALNYDKVLPAIFGWGLALFAAVGTVLFGPSGFLIVIPQAIYILVIAYRSRSR